jgi:hypothetical protein
MTDTTARLLWRARGWRSTMPETNTLGLVIDGMIDTIERLTYRLNEANARADRMQEALKEIALLRPPGDVNTCKQPRMLVENMECIALKTLDTPPDPDKRAAALSDLAALDGETM